MTERLDNIARRFRGPADFLKPDELLRRLRRFAYWGLMGAIVITGIPVIYLATRDDAKKAPKPPIMHLIVRKPRMTKPFEFEKRKIPKRKMTRQVTAAKPEIKRRPQLRRPDLIGKIKTFRFGVDTGADLGLEVVQPDIQRVAISSPKDPEKRISMQEEFLDLDALDIGKYKGLVIQDPTDKQNITGFVYLSLAWGNDWEPATQRAIFELVEAINNYTQIRAEVDDHLFLDSRDIYRTPFVYITVGEAFVPTEREVENLGSYLRNGGFALVENATPDIEYSPAEASLRQMLKQALGRDARFRVLPNDHPIYHSFFDFDDGPPPQRSEDRIDFQRDFRPEVPYLEGIFLGDRLVVVFSNKAYGIAWEKEFRNEPQLQIGINLVVFALPQQGSIAQQQIDFFKETTQ